MKLPNRRGFIAEFTMSAMVLFEHGPEQATVEGWSDSDLKAALDWAQGAYLARQIDSTMPEPRKPSCLRHYQ